MFKKFTEKENVSGVTQLKSSVQKGIRQEDCLSRFELIKHTRGGENGRREGKGLRDIFDNS